MPSFEKEDGGIAAASRETNAHQGAGQSGSPDKRTPYRSDRRGFYPR